MSWSRTSLLGLGLAALLGGCTHASSPTPPPAPASTPPPQPQPIGARAASEPAEPQGGHDTPAPAPITDVPLDAVTWFQPLPALTLGVPSDADKARIAACIEPHGITQPDPTAPALMAAATCLGDIPQPGHEIRLYTHLIQVHPDAPEAVDATRLLGLRLEQVDVRDRAIETYAAYLRRFPKQADARTLGQRAVCLARSLGADGRVDELLQALERLYGRRGFTRPSSADLARLCAAAPTGPAQPRVADAPPSP